MSFHRWLQNLGSSLASSRDKGKPRRQGSPRIAPNRLSFEVLEVRCLLAFSPADAIDFSSLKIDPNSYDASSILVRFHEGADRLRGDDFLRGTEIGKTSTLVSGLHTVQLKGVGVADALRAYQASGLVQYAEPNYTVHIMQTPNDPQFGSLYGLHNTGQNAGTADADIDAPAAWDITTGDGTVVVAIIDTGVDYTHPDLVNNIWINQGEIPNNNVDDDGNGVVDDIHGANFIGSGAPTGDPMDDHYHGTHVAGTIGAEGNNGIGVVGVAWDVQIMALKFLDSGGSGNIDDAIGAVEYATMMRTQYGVNVRLSSNSWGGGPYTQALSDAIEAGGAAGILFVAAAGNSGTDADFDPMYPAAYDSPYIVSVAATDRNDVYASFSNYGATSVDLAAPGVDTLSAMPGNSYGTLSGTSMATPHVSGAAALIWSQFPDLTPLQVKERLLSSVDDISAIPGNSSKPTQTNGRLNAQGALDAVNDLIPPAPVVDLAVTGSGLATVSLTFTATGDDGVVGTADFYDIRYSTAPIVTESDFAAAGRSTSEPSPQSPGSTEIATVTGLDFGTTYYFAMKVVDNAGNASLLSNTVSATTQDAIVAFADDMESGAAGWSADGLWHLSNRRAYSPVTSFYYGDENTGTYDTGFTNWGSLTSPAIDLTAATEATLLFDEWRQVEGGSPYDGAYLFASSDALNWTMVWADYATTGDWVTRTFDVTPWVGGNLFVQFYFETVDELYNSFEGWYVDNVTVLTPGALTPGLSIKNASITEGNTGSPSVTFTVQLVDVPGGATVNWTTADGSATSADNDYVPGSGVVTFLPGETSQTFTIAVNPDRIDEANEVFFVNLSGAIGADIVDGQGQGTIVDDDTAGISVSPSSGLVTTESGGSANFSVVLNSEPTGNVTITLSSSDATEGMVSPMSLTFTPLDWNSPKAVTLTGVNDSIDDGDVSYFVAASAASTDPNYNGLAAGAAAINQDNDAVATYTSTVVKNIPDAGKVTSAIVIADSRTILDLNVRVDITHGRDEDLDVFLITPWGTRIELFTDVGGSGKNFTNTILDDEAATAINAGTAPFNATYRPEGLLSAADGKNTSGTWTLEITDDKKGAPKGKLNSWSLTFLYEQPASGGGAGGQGVGTMVDNEPRISISDVTKTEGKKGQTTLFTFTVTLSTAYDQPVTMSFKTANGTATTSNSDYVAKTGTLTFAPGETTKTITIEVKGDNKREAHESFFVDLYNNSANSLFTKNRGLGTILNDD
jgi:subtilisin family serine protease/subtilisin-like proprotein convertase family protein